MTIAVHSRANYLYTQKTAVGVLRQFACTQRLPTLCTKKERINMKRINQFTIAFSVSLSKMWILLGSIATLISSPGLAVDLGLTSAVSGIPSQRR